MISQHTLFLYLWIAPHALLIAIIGGMLKNGRYREFPFFFSYAVFEVFQFGLLFVMSRLDVVSVSAYTEADLLCRTGSLALHFGIINELFESPLESCPSLRRSVARPLHVASILFVGIASIFTALLYVGDHSITMIRPYVLEQVIDTAQCGLLVVVFAWHRFLGLWMKDSAFGIAVGLGLVVGLEPLLHGLRYLDGNSTVPNMVGAVAFHVSALVWLYFTQVQEKTSVVPGPEQSIDIRGWNAELARFSQL